MNYILIMMQDKKFSFINQKIVPFYGHLSLNTKEAKKEDEIFKSDWSQRGLKASGNNQTTKHTSIHDYMFA